MDQCSLNADTEGTKIELMYIDINVVDRGHLTAYT